MMPDTDFLPVPTNLPRAGLNPRAGRRSSGARRSLPFAAALLGVVAAASAGAVDGVVEINAASAIAGGVTAGDTPGYPVTISEPGSYRLTGSLETQTASRTLIEITANDVTLDLNGFGLQGPAVCTGYPVNDCTPSASGYGVLATSGRDVAVHDGWVRGMGRAIVLPTNDEAASSRIERVRAVGNALGGITATLVADCEVSQNGGHGIAGQLVTDNVVKGNAGVGIRTVVGARSLVRDNLVDGSGQAGIQTGEGARIAGNTVTRSGSDGIDAGATSLVTGNVSTRNAGLGLDQFSGSHSNNLFFFNNPNGSCLNPQVSGSGADAGSNVCCGSSCP